jgi:hypothetical protein
MIAFVRDHIGWIALGWFAVLFLILTVNYRARRQLDRDDAEIERMLQRTEDRLKGSN